MEGMQLTGLSRLEAFGAGANRCRSVHILICQQQRLFSPAPALTGHLKHGFLLRASEEPRPFVAHARAALQWSPSQLQDQSAQS